MITSDQIIELGKIIGAITIIIGAVSSAIVFLRRFFKTIKKIEDIYTNYETIDSLLADMKQDLQCVITSMDKQNSEISNIKKHMENNNDLTLNLARYELLTTLKDVIDNGGWDSSEQYGVTCKMFDSYVKNGGNSEVCALMEKAKTFKTYKRNLIDIKK